MKWFLGAPILGCAQPTCIAGLKSKKDDSNFLVNLNGQADGFMREEENDNRAYSSNLYDNKLIAVCFLMPKAKNVPQSLEWWISSKQSIKPKTLLRMVLDFEILHAFYLLCS